jgi:hypothetical protein
MTNKPAAMSFTMYMIESAWACQFVELRAVIGEKFTPMLAERLKT